jgi:hypothetical protein
MAQAMPDLTAMANTMPFPDDCDDCDECLDDDSRQVARDWVLEHGVIERDGD